MELLYVELCAMSVIMTIPATPRPSQPNSKQPKLEEVFPQNEKALNSAMDEAVVDFLADSGVAFRVAGLPSFQRMMKLANKRIKLKHPQTYSRMVKPKVAQIKQDLLAKSEFDCVGFTTDMWTSVSGNPFMSLTVHFIDKDWTLHRFTPFVAPFPA